jgi:hypothetical protein
MAQKITLNNGDIVGINSEKYVVLIKDDNTLMFRPYYPIGTRGINTDLLVNRILDSSKVYGEESISKEYIDHLGSRIK